LSVAGTYLERKINACNGNRLSNDDVVLKFEEIGDGADESLEFVLWHFVDWKSKHYLATIKGCLSRVDGFSQDFDSCAESIGDALGEWRTNWRSVAALDAFDLLRISQTHLDGKVFLLPAA
jgi:hypothetical protein